MSSKVVISEEQLVVTQSKESKPEENSSLVLTLLSMVKIFVVFLLPAVMSINSITAWNNEESQSWLKYWVVISFLTPLDIITNKWRGKITEILKIIFIIWCLAPIEHNGTVIVYNKIVYPVYKTSEEVLFEVAKKAVPCLICNYEAAQDFTRKIPSMVETSEKKLIENSAILYTTTKQLVELIISKIIQQEEKPRLFSDVYKDFKYGTNT